MAKCFSIASAINSLYKYSFTRTGLKSTTTDLGEGTIIHCWVPKNPKPRKPNLLLIHGIGANAMWQWADFIRRLAVRFNVYVPDLVFFGKSYTSRPDRSEAFQAQCVAATMEVNGVRRMSVVGLSYGGFVAYSMADQFPERVERLVLCCAGVTAEDRDMGGDLFRVKSLEEAVSVLFPQTVDKLRELVKLAFFKPNLIVPSCFLSDFIDEMCTEYIQERKELVQALHKDRKLSNLPKITQPTLAIWGEYDQIFPLELAHRLERHLGENVRLIIIKNAGHAINKEKPKEMYKHIKSFLMDPIPQSMLGNNSTGCNVDKRVNLEG